MFVIIVVRENEMSDWSIRYYDLPIAGVATHGVIVIFRGDIPINSYQGVASDAQTGKSVAIGAEFLGHKLRALVTHGK